MFGGIIFHIRPTIRFCRHYLFLLLLGIFGYVCFTFKSNYKIANSTVSTMNNKTNLFDRKGDSLMQHININENERKINTAKHKTTKLSQKKNWLALSLNCEKSKVNKKTGLEYSSKVQVTQRNGNQEQSRGTKANVKCADSDDITLIRKVDETKTLKKYLCDDFSQFCNSTQVVRQLDEIINNVTDNKLFSNPTLNLENQKGKRKSWDLEDLDIDHIRSVNKENYKNCHRVDLETNRSEYATNKRHHPELPVSIRKSSQNVEHVKFQIPNQPSTVKYKIHHSPTNSKNELCSAGGAHMLSEREEALTIFNFLLEENNFSEVGKDNEENQTVISTLSSEEGCNENHTHNLNLNETETGDCNQFITKYDKNIFNHRESINNDFIDNSEEECKKIENRMTQLLNTSQYRKEVSQLFQNLEQSICQFGSKEMNKIDWFEDSAMTEVILSKITQECGGSMADIIKKALKENLNKSLITKTLVNSTLTAIPIVFKELGPFYGLPKIVQELIKTYKGIDNLYDWQHECLSLPAVKQRKNLIYSLPTSGGKTLVAEILILREILCRKQNVIFVLPYVSIVQEKVWALSPFAVALDFLVEEYAAGKGTYPPRKRRYKNSVYIATTEKAMGLINSLIEKGRLGELGLIVVDELHLIGDDQRGPTLETLLTKLMYMTDDVQIVGMSATIGNLSDMCQFLNAELYTRNFRPVELVEYVKCGRKIAKVNLVADSDNIFEFSRATNFNYSEKLLKVDPDHLGALVMEVIPMGSCLIFCPTKKNAENVTKLLCEVISRKLMDHKVSEKKELFKALENDTGAICSILKKSIPFGVAYHHSGLTTDERRLIEEAYRASVLSVICCTSTLAAGVNLPAKRVIIRKPYIAQDFINLSRYKQMIGRAGRAGLGEVGESILICNLNELLQVKELFISPMDQTMSKLHDSECSRLRQLFLSCITLGTANTKAQLKTVISKSLLAVQQAELNVNIKTLVKKVIYDLYKLQALEINNNSSSDDFSCFLNNGSFINDTNETSVMKRTIKIDDNTKLTVSKLGNAAMKGNLNLTEAHLLYKDLCKAKESLVLINCLHLLFLITPYSLVDLVKPEKIQFHHILSQLKPEERKTATVLGITESCIVRMLSNQQIKSVSRSVLNRFYMSLMLYELWNEVSVIEVSEKYQVNRGIVQNLMTNAATFAANVVNFCEQLEELWPFVYLLKGMSQRLLYCCCRDILPLMELPAVKQGRAKQLFNAGFKTLQSIAKANPEELVQSVEFMSHKVAQQLIAAAKMLLLEKVENLREEAEDVLDGVEISTK